MKIIDLRSDTVTQPTEEMRHAMAAAVVGDDVYQDDPTVNRLEALAAQQLGKEAALFVPSGTFGNIVSVMTHTGRGDEIILEESCHIFIHEVGATAVVAGVQARTIPGVNGMMPIERIEAAVRSDDIHEPPTRLICLENAHSTGVALPLDYMKEVQKIANRHGLAIHLDGARLFNAATALGVDAAEIAACCDSVMFCLSKGLCAPVGSMVVSTAEFIRKARKNRKMLGGGMRQAGVLAAAGIIALEQMSGRLGEDHQNARLLAQGLAKIPGVSVLEDRLGINMVFCRIPTELIDPRRMVDCLTQQGIRINSSDDGLYRLVTNHGVSQEDVKHVRNEIAKLLAE